MARLLRLSRLEELDEATREALRASSSVFHLDPLHVTFGELRAARVAVRPAADVLPPDAEWLILGISEVEGRGAGLEKLVSIVDRLLGPGGCPWDQEQTHESLKRHLLEEAYEVLDAIDSGSLEKLKEELGDLLLQPLMHAQMQARDGNFDIFEVADGICNKLIRRHPHVFGEVDAKDSDEVLRNWDAIKRAEKGENVAASVLDGVPIGMASLLRAFEVSKRAARSGFEWADLEGVFEKLREEETELREAIAEGVPEKIEAEIGDLLFTAVNLARWSNVGPEDALRKMLNRFTARFQEMERNAAKPLRELTAQEWDDLWELSKTNTTG